MKKLLVSVLVSLMVIVPISVQANAKEVTTEIKGEVQNKIVIPKHMKKVTVSEYDMYKQLQKKSNETLLKDGWDTKKIQEFRQDDFVQTLKERSKLSKNELKQMGYSDEKVNLLQNNTDWSESKVRALSSDLNISGGLSYTSDNNCSWTFYYQWGWDSNPTFRGYDVMGARWIGSTNGNTSVPALSSANVHINMIDTDDGYKKLYTTTIGMDKVDLNAAQARFHGYETLDVYRAFAMSGYETFTLNNSAPMERVTLAVKYGHTTSTLALNPSISLSGPNVSFSFSFGVTEAGSLITTYRTDGSEVK